MKKSNTPAEQKAIDLFHYAYKNCTAYNDFIKKSGIKVSSIKTIADFKNVPYTDKQNYIKKYPLKDRIFKDKKLSDFYMVCSSSGSTGKPTLWPRDYEIDTGLEKAKAAMLEEHFAVSKQKTLGMITFALGVWTAGMLSSKLSWPLSLDHDFSLVTPGMDKNNTFEMIKALHADYDQIIIMGYPPFLAELIKHARHHKFDLKRANIKLFYTSERVSEQWRNEMAHILHEEGDRKSVVGFYACSDTGIVGMETKNSIDLLELCNNKVALCRDLFKEDNPPTFVHYNPEIKFLESIDDQIVITANQPVPLIRYNIHDRGNILTKKEIISALKKHTITFDTNALDDHYAYIFGRSDAVKLTANIYIEDIKYCLEKSKYAHRLSGSFKYGTEKIKNFRDRLKIIIYLQKGKTLTKREKDFFEKEFYTNLLKANDDFKTIQKGTKVEKFRFVYEEDDPTKFKTSKLQYFL